jgi:hypothetical protein
VVPPSIGEAPDIVPVQAGTTVSTSSANTPRAFLVGRRGAAIAFQNRRRKRSSPSDLVGIERGYVLSATRFTRQIGDESTVKRDHMATKKKTSAPKKVRASKKAPRKAAPAKTYAARKDLGAPVAGFFAKQPAHLRPILDELRRLVDEAAPDASSGIKWGMPFYEMKGTTLCALAAHKSHVNLILPGPPGTYPDPEGLLEGEGKTGRHLKVKTLDDLPKAQVRGWLRTAVRLARQGA